MSVVEGREQQRRKLSQQQSRKTSSGHDMREAGKVGTEVERAKSIKRSQSKRLANATTCPLCRKEFATPKVHNATGERFS